MKELKNWLVFISIMMIPTTVCAHYKIEYGEFALICVMLTPICAIFATAICKYMGWDE